jgi:hypothetical protein
MVRGPIRVALVAAKSLRPAGRDCWRAEDQVKGILSVRSWFVFVEASLAGIPKIPPALKERATRIQVLLMDVDGTMTDGSVTLLSQADVSEPASWFADLTYAVASAA